ncbi:response regulator [Natronogracilivirga saccharolytica]|uniref:Response regulator n=1 Tax=Natronogracilivirga saccharolytica TaxID=2812953 RepID=A0A8J7RPF7_9BACT|nr:response regulator [Natronogracilivirga saccharolytica]MBP3191444.1 response regulator [Natronogracilivirga saccharolytica]
MERSDIYILCIEDEQEVLDAVVRDLEQLEEQFPIETANTAEEGRKIIEKLLNDGMKIGLILCDHILPGDNGVELLIELHKDERTHPARKVLLTGQAGLDDTVKALNEARLHHYIAKPWKKEELLRVSVDLLTDYVISNEEDLLPYMKSLDAGKISEAIRTRRNVSDS